MKKLGKNSKVNDAKQMAKLKNSKVEKLEEELAELKTNQTKLVLDLENYKATKDRTNLLTKNFSSEFSRVIIFRRILMS